MQTNAEAVFAEINRACEQNTALSLLLANVTDFAISRITNQWAVSHFYCTKTNIKELVLKSSNGYQVRNIPVCIERGNKQEDKYQDMVIEFDENGKISDLTIALSHHQYANVITTSVTDLLRQRQIILDFVENFRTAYNRKELPYIEKVFSDEALIITGKELERDGRIITTLTTEDKGGYIKKLRRIFDGNSYINIKFDEIKVKQDEGKPDFYYVYLTQDWNSSTYSDKGWLLLTIQFRGEDHPLIWVRAWQPLDSANPGRRRTTYKRRRYSYRRLIQHSNRRLKT
ncbi:MAG: hypothetical protein LBH04_06185 [Tannerellaceae bacterium]|nr:hypothetical protein [Tannerellaceae bacterium]